VIKVKTIDPQITDLRLSTEDCRGEKIHYSYTSTQGVLEGEYEIKQWVNHFTWLNRAGKGFSSEKVDPADLQLGKEYQTPDWMERRVAEVINLFPEALPYVERIFVEKDEKLAGHYELETKLIWIRPNMLSIRYNYPYKNGYGFYTERGLDGTARHEAYHAFEWHRVRDKDHNKDRLFPDNDPIKAIIVGDDLPGVSGGPISGAGGEKFQYIYDSAENKFGPVEKDAISPGYPTGYEYKGDNIWDRGYGDDYPTGSIKRFVEKIDFSSAMLDGEQIVIILPSDIPTSNNFSEQLYFEVRRGRKKYEALELVKDKHYRISMLNQKTVSPWLCLELINRAEWETLFKQEKIKIEDTKSLYLKYETCIPLFHKHPREYDASRIEPAEYVGQWSGGD
jgi:hypothetical protein